MTAQLMTLAGSAALLRGKRAWSRIKTSAAEQRQLWREVGEALNYGRALEPTDIGFKTWCERNDFGDMHRNDRADAMWLADNWDTVQKHSAPGLTHPHAIRADVRKLAPAPELTLEPSAPLPDLPAIHKQARKIHACPTRPALGGATFHAKNVLVTTGHIRVNLYRVIPFQRFLQIIDESALAFVSYELFADDPHEGGLVQALLHADGVQLVSDTLRHKMGCNGLLEGLITGARSAARSAYMQCWSKSKPHNLMWRYYGNGDNAVMIRTDALGLQAIPDFITFHEARYEPFDVERELRKVVTPVTGRVSISQLLLFSNDTHDFSGGSRVIDFRESFTLKDPEYQHENEVRLMSPIINSLGHEVDTQPKVKQIRIKPSKVIKGVMTGPNASHLLEEAVSRVCAHAGIPYEGKSDMLQRRFTGSRRIWTSDPDHV